MAPGEPLQFAFQTNFREFPAVTEQVVDHPHQPQLLAVLGRVNLGDAVGFQLGDLRRDDHASSSAEHLDVAGLALTEAVNHVAKELQVAALVGTHRDGGGVLLNGGVHDLAYRAVVPQVNHLGPLPLEDAPHDVDRRVVAVEQTGGGNDAGRERGFRLVHGLTRMEF